MWNEWSMSGAPLALRDMLRTTSPVSGSTLTTSAPMSASTAPALGAAIQLEISTTRTPSNGPTVTSGTFASHRPYGGRSVAVMTSGPPGAIRHGRREPTVIVSRRARPGRERELERWLRRLVVRAADAPGYVDAELQPPNALHPDEWVVVYRFTDPAALETWLRSPARQELMATGSDLIEGEPREQVLALTPDSERVTAVSSVRVKPEEMAAFLALHGEILVALSGAPGFLRADIFEPVPGVQDDTVVVLAFDTREHLDAWLASDERRRILAEMERHTIGERTVNVVGGFAGWFAPGGGSSEVRVGSRRPPCCWP